MGKIGRILCIALLACFAAGFLHAQSLPAVAAFSLSADDVGDNVYRTVNDLVFSFIRELRTYRIIDMRADALPRDLGVPDGADYLFYGSLTGAPDGIKLELVLKGGPYLVTRKISRVYDNSNRILLESRMLVRDLFDQSVSLPEPVPGDEASRLSAAGTVSGNTRGDALEPVSSPDALAGSWRGEPGVEKVLILRGGRGVAVLSSGISISLELFVSSGNLEVRQKGSPNPRQFIDLPDPVARQAAIAAPSLEWSFRTSGDRRKLVGTKKSVAIRHDGQNIISMESVSADVVWQRD